jgi:fructose-bisphosphate aldolase class II
LPHRALEQVVSLIGTADAVATARPGGLAAFNVIQIEHAEAIAAAAERAGRPVVLQISENCVAYHGGLAPLASACLHIAEESSADIVVHLDHAIKESLVFQAVDLGIGSVMFDASALPYEENVAATAKIAAWCHERGAWLEAELGEVGGKDGVHAPGARTDPAEAARYVAATGIDALAVAVGSSHAMLTRDAQLDNELITALAAAVDVPLVLHGSSGVPDEGIVQAIHHGVVKVNIATQLNKVLTAAVRESFASHPDEVDPRRWMGRGRDAIGREAEHLLRVMG